MSEPHLFLVRPVFHGTELLIEFVGNHRSEGYPPVERLLQKALGSIKMKHPLVNEVRAALTQDRLFSFWSYSEGEYEIDNDKSSLFIAAKRNNVKILADIENALIACGQFARKEVDFGRYV